MPWISPLLEWFREHQRAMPWRAEGTPYRVWISEIMLQQTQVDTVIPYFERFVAAFPDVQALAAADEQKVLKLWQGLGYYSRARNLHRCAQVVLAEHGGELPADYAALMKLPGLGAYTAAAVASIAFGQAVPVVDGNVLRVTSRLFELEDDIAKPKTRDAVFKRLSPAIERSGHPSDFNQAMMELGALVCRPSSPTCLLCPVNAHCQALATGRVDELPVKTKGKAVPHKDLAAALIRRDGQVLLVQRPTDGMLGGLWELPTVERRPREAAAKALARALPALLGADVAIETSLGEVRHAYSHFTITVAVHACELPGDHDASGPQPLAWVDPTATDQPLHKATIKALALITD